MKHSVKLSLVLGLLIISGLFSFRRNDESTEIKRDLKTEYVIVLIIDGPRFSETFGDSTYQYIPNLSSVLAPQGVLVKNFRNNGTTHTNAGHTAICTGVYQRIKNNGLELPRNPSMFQYFLKQKGLDPNQAWVIASKGKLDILTNTKDKEWNGKFRPSSHCGIDGKGLGYTADEYTWRDAKQILSAYHPKLTLINLLEVDVNGHQAKWQGYLQGIRNTDKTALELWEFIQADSVYKDKTTLIITNDHGRHLPKHKDGFISHGDNCLGCRSIYLVALGPDFKQGVVLDDYYEQLDISRTISYMLDFEMPTSQGKVMEKLFR